MSDFDTVNVADFGKVIFIPRNHTVPALPDMNLLVLKNDDNFQAVCIDIEIDAVGETVKDACGNLKQAILAYTSQMVYNHDGNVEAAAKDIINTVYGHGVMKSRLFTHYLATKHQYLLGKIAKKQRINSRRERIANALRGIFQIEPIGLNLTLAEGIA